MKYIECLRKGCPRVQDDDEGLKCLDGKEPDKCEGKK